MFAAVLIAHIAGAILTSVAVLYALYVLMRADARRMRSVFLALSFLAAFEVVTGVLLAVLSESVTVASVCDNIAAYLALAGVMEVALFSALRRAGSAVPVSAAISPAIGSFAVLAAGVLLGF